MEFISGKEQRVLGVIDFVLLLVDSFLVSCIRPSGDSDDDDHNSNDSHPSLSSQSSIDTVDVNAQDTSQMAEGNNGKSIVLRILEVILDIFKFLQLSVFVTLLVLLHKDLYQCNDPILFIPIYLGFAVIEFNLFFYLTHHDRFQKYFKQRRGRRDDEVEEATQNVFASINIFHQFAVSRSGWLRQLEARIASFPERHGSFVSYAMSVLGSVVVVLISLSSLALAVLGVYFFVTTIKIAIPSGDYEAMCVTNDTLIRNVMISIPAVVIINYAIRAVDLVLPRLRRLSNPGALHILQSFVNSVFQISATVLYIILAVRSTKVWRGEEFNIYEYIAIAVSLPTIDALLDGY